MEKLRQSLKESKEKIKESNETIDSLRSSLKDSNEMIQEKETKTQDLTHALEAMRESSESLEKKMQELSSRLDSEIEEKNAIHTKYNQVHKTNTQHVELLSEAEKEIEKLATERNAATVRIVSPVQQVFSYYKTLTTLSFSLSHRKHKSSGKRLPRF